MSKDTDKKQTLVKVANGKYQFMTESEKKKFESKGKKENPKAKATPEATEEE